MIDCLLEGVECQYPYRVYDTVFYMLLLRDLRTELNAIDASHVEITAALRASQFYAEERYPVEFMAEHMDYLNVMTFDYHDGSQSSMTSPLTGCYNPFIYSELDDVDCVTTEFGALDETDGSFVEGAFSDCFGLCNGYNYGQAGSGFEMQFKKIK